MTRFRILYNTAKTAAFATCLMLSPFILTAQTTAGQEVAVKKGLLGALSGDGGRVVLETKRFADGSDPRFHIGTDEAGNRFFEAAGELSLQSDKLNLESGELYYSNTEGVLRAKNDVVLNTDGVYAESGLLNYSLENQGLRLEQNPFVRQESPENIITFRDMNIFTVTPQGLSRQIDLSGSLVNMSIEPVEQPAGQATTAAPAEGGLSGLGNNIRITAKERPGQQAIIRTRILEDNSTDKIEMLGSVVLKSDEFNIRGNELIYDPDNQTFTARGDVLLQQENVTADCGLMVYDLARKVVRFSDKPDVRLVDGPETVIYEGYDAINVDLNGETPGATPEGVGRLIMQRTADIQNQ